MPDKLKYGLLALLILGFVALTGYEITTWQNALGIGELVLPAGLIGAVVGAWLGYLLGGSFRESTDRMRVTAIGIFAGAIFFLTFSSMLNRSLSDSPKTVPFEFVRMEVYGASRFGQWQDSIPPDGYYLYFRQLPANDTQRIRLTYPYPGSPDPGDMILLPVREGFFGVDIIDMK